MDQKWNASPGNWGKPCPTWAIIGWGPLLETPQVPPENPEGPTAAVEGEAAELPWENGNLENGGQGLLVPLEAHSISEEGSPHE